MKNCLSFFLLPRPVVRFFISFIVLVGIFSPFVFATRVSAADVGCDPIDGATAEQKYCRVGHEGIDGCTTIKCTDPTVRGGNSAGNCCDSPNPGAPPTACTDPTQHRVCATNPGPPPTTDTNKCSCNGFPIADKCGGLGQPVCTAPFFLPDGSSVPEAGPWELCEPGLFSFTPDGGGINFCATTQAEANTAAGNFSSFNLCASSGDTTGLCVSCANTGGVWTAVGCIPTTRKDIVSTFLTIAISLSGGIILLRLLQASFMLSTSQGEPNKVKEAQEIFTSSFAGLLFVLFSMVILSSIGVNILQIPGF